MVTYPEAQATHEEVRRSAERQRALGVHHLTPSVNTASAQRPCSGPCLTLAHCLTITGACGQAAVPDDVGRGAAAFGHQAQSPKGRGRRSRLAPPVQRGDNAWRSRPCDQQKAVVS